MKILKAQIKARSVIVESGAALDVEIIGGGGDSSGYLFLNDGDALYLPIAVDDLRSMIDIISALADAVNNGVLKSNSGGPIVAPTLATDIAKVKADLLKLKGALK